jgi:hypothetical protein
MRLAAICTVILSLGLASCETNSPALAPPAAITVAKAEYAFETSYNVAAQAYLAAVKAKALTATDKDRAKALLGQAYAALLVARQAQLAGDAPTVQLQAAAITGLTAQVLQLVHRP